MEWVTAKLEAAAAALGKSTGLEQAARRARLEQRVEDYNALQKASGTFHRAVLVLPLTPEFDPPRGQPGHGRVQFSDRVSASASVGKEYTRAEGGGLALHQTLYADALQPVAFKDAGGALSSQASLDRISDAAGVTALRGGIGADLFLCLTMRDPLFDLV